MKEQVLEWHTFEATGRGSLVRYKLTLSSRASKQHVFGCIEVAVVDLRLDAQDVTHQGVDVYTLERSHQEILVKRWTHCPEERFHVQLLIVKAMLSFVELNWEILQRHRGTVTTSMRMTQFRLN